MKTIVAATDFSAWAHYALERAAQIARASGAELHLLHVPAQGLWSQGTGMFSQYFGDGNTPALDSERERLQQAAAGLARRFRVKAQCHVVPGKAAAEIASFATARDADLVVLATRGEGGLRPSAVGGTALKVLWQSLVPVLLVRQPTETAYRKLLVATDLSERSAYVCRIACEAFPKASVSLVHAFRAEFETALELAGAETDALRQYRADVGVEAAERLKAFWSDIQSGGRRRAQRFLAHGHPVPVVLKAAADVKPDLVVLGKHAGAQWEERVLGSVVQNLLLQLKTDVLVVP
jgi:nucleotide-binding universal stress UspA family protein